MVCISALCAAYAIFAAVSSWFKFFVSKAWIFFASDQVQTQIYQLIMRWKLACLLVSPCACVWMNCFEQIVAYLLVTSVAAVLEILQLAYNGDQEVTWSEACRSYGKFCNKMKIAFVLQALTLICFIILAVISAYRFFSLFEPPSVSSSKEVEEQRN